MYLLHPFRIIGLAASCSDTVSSQLSLSHHLLTTSRSRLKSWRFTALLPWACAVYCAGFVTRHVSCFHQTNVGLFISSLCLLYVAPLVFLHLIFPHAHTDFLLGLFSLPQTTSPLAAPYTIFLTSLPSILDVWSALSSGSMSSLKS